MMHELPPPQFCCFGIVDECMFRCQMCYKWREDIKVKEKRVLPADAWRRAVDGLVKIVPKPHEFVINFGGGEALMRPDLLDIVRYAAGKGFITNIASNGWLIDESMAERIARSGLRTINLSLDSLRPEVHDRLRGVPGATEQVFHAIKRLRKYSPTLEIGICSVIYDATVNELPALTRWVQTNPDVNWIVFMAAMQPNNTDRCEDWYRAAFKELWPKQPRHVAWRIYQLMWRKWWGWKIQNSYHQLRAFIRYFRSPERFVKRGECNMNRAIHISSGGDMFLCFEHAKLGNIATDALDEVWRSEAAARGRESIRLCRRNCHFLLNCFFEKDIWRTT